MSQIAVTVTEEGPIQVRLPSSDVAELLADLEQGTGLLRLLKDSNGQYALGLKNLTTGAYVAICTTGTGGNAAVAICSLP